MAVDTSPLSRQPTKLDYASPTQFRFGIHQLPKVDFFAVTATLPAIALSDVVIPTPFKSIPMMGDQLTYDNLSVGFIVDEFLENYLSINEWLTAIGFPKSRNNFQILKQISLTLQHLLEVQQVQVMILVMYNLHHLLTHYFQMQHLLFYPTKIILS